jgi:predicted DNA-binding ribbon-helix-helix protein
MLYLGTACALHAANLRLQIHIQLVSYLLSSTATIVARTRLNIMLHVHCLSWLNIAEFLHISTQTHFSCVKKNICLIWSRALVEALSDQREKKTNLSSMLKCTDFQEAHNSTQWTKVFHHQVYISIDLRVFSFQTCWKSRGKVPLICWLCRKGYVEYK